MKHIKYLLIAMIFTLSGCQAKISYKIALDYCEIACYEATLNILPKQSDTTNKMIKIHCGLTCLTQFMKAH